ncbi:MAG TPA: hypothetical protein VKU01_04970 [Bryobacteraceae bacterium]|nr:hypothetical protein [Bryobacteraceae bacterium]
MGTSDYIRRPAPVTQRAEQPSYMNQPPMLRTTIPVHFASFLALLAALVATQAIVAQQVGSPSTEANPSPESATSATPAPAQPSAPDKRVFGVLPNYRTVEGLEGVEPITAKQKLTIAAKDSFDWPGFFIAGAFSALAQEDNTNPSFGQGLKGYAHRYITAYGDQVIGNFMTEGIIPSLLHDDPRYFRKGQGTFRGRLGYASTRVFVTRTDAGTWRMNTAELFGNGITASIGNAYYPGARGFAPTMQRMWTQIGTDAISNVLKEFWPDVKRHYFSKKQQDHF